MNAIGQKREYEGITWIWLSTLQYIQNTNSLSYIRIVKNGEYRLNDNRKKKKKSKKGLEKM